MLTLGLTFTRVHHACFRLKERHLLGIFIHEIDTCNMSGTPVLTPHVLSTFTVINDETWKYLAFVQGITE